MRAKTSWHWRSKVTTLPPNTEKANKQHCLLTELRQQILSINSLQSDSGRKEFHLRFVGSVLRWRHHKSNTHLPNKTQKERDLNKNKAKRNFGKTNIREPGYLWHCICAQETTMWCKSFNLESPNPPNTHPNPPQTLPKLSPNLPKSIHLADEVFCHPMLPKQRTWE